MIESADGRWIAAEVKLGGASAIDEAASDLLRLSARVSAERAHGCAGLMVITGGKLCYQRPDGVAVVPLGCLGP